jgi:hypothetical protein
MLACLVKLGKGGSLNVTTGERQDSVAKNRLKAERALTIFSETFDGRFQVAPFSGRDYPLGNPLVLPLWC